MQRSKLVCKSVAYTPATSLGEPVTPLHALYLGVVRRLAYVCVCMYVLCMYVFPFSDRRTRWQCIWMDPGSFAMNTSDLATSARDCDTNAVVRLLATDSYV